MRAASLPLRRLRLELDRTLRCRPFFSRALRGQLEPSEYLDLLWQCGALLVLAGEPHTSVLLRCLAVDVCEMKAATGATVGEPCALIGMLAGITRHEEDLRRSQLPRTVCLSVLSTSWVDEIAREMGASAGASAAFLTRLAAEGRQCLSTLELELDRRTLDGQLVISLSELTRGIVLGLATYLDSRWPAPIHQVAAEC